MFSFCCFPKSSKVHNISTNITLNNKQEIITQKIEKLEFFLKNYLLEFDRYKDTDAIYLDIGERIKQGNIIELKLQQEFATASPNLTVINDLKKQKLKTLKQTPAVKFNFLVCYWNFIQKKFTAFTEGVEEFHETLVTANIKIDMFYQKSILTYTENCLQRFAELNNYLMSDEVPGEEIELTFTGLDKFIDQLKNLKKNIKQIEDLIINFKKSLTQNQTPESKQNNFILFAADKNSSQANRKLLLWAPNKISPKKQAQQNNQSEVKTEKLNKSFYPLML